MVALWYAELARDTNAAPGPRNGALGRSPARSDVRPPRSGDREAVCQRSASAGADLLAGDPARSSCAALTTLAITAASLEQFARKSAACRGPRSARSKPFGKGRGSSAMPHKRNPIGCEQIIGLARLLRGNAMAALENVALWHERDISHRRWSASCPRQLDRAHYMVRRFTRIVSGMVVLTDRMLGVLRIACAEHGVLGPGPARAGITARPTARTHLRMGPAQHDALV